VAEKGFLFWEQDSERSIQDALDVYDRQHREDVIARATEEAIKEYQEHRSVDELGQKMIQIALDNRLCKYYFKNGIIYSLKHCW
jgi:hypothetical protein